jgi:hypothetical protein
MMFNLMADAGLGFVPLVGDLASAIYKSNTRNAIILEHLLIERGLRNLGHDPAQLGIERKKAKNDPHGEPQISIATRHVSTTPGSKKMEA